MASTKHPGAVALAKLRAQSLTPERRSEIARTAGRAGGSARAAKLSAKQRREIARKAGKAGAAARWKKPTEG